MLARKQASSALVDGKFKRIYSSSPMIMGDLSIKSPLTPLYQRGELSGYDYFWGSGRDMRGKNNFGKVLMGVRDKLRSEREQNA